MVQLRFKLTATIVYPLAVLNIWFNTQTIDSEFGRTLPIDLILRNSCYQDEGGKGGRADHSSVSMGAPSDE